MSELGPINYGPTMDITEWGKTYWERNSVSQDMLAKIDDEVKKIITARYKIAVQLIKVNKSPLDKIAEALLKNESLDQEEFEKIVGSKTNIS